MGFINLAVDIILFFIFMKSFSLKYRKDYLLIIIFTLYCLYRLIYGYNGASFALKDIFIICLETLLFYKACRSFYSLGKNTSITESLIFVISLQIGRKLFFNVAEPLIINTVFHHQLLCQFSIIVLKVLSIIPVMPDCAKTSESSIQHSEILLLLFALFNCFVLGVLNLNNSNTLIYANLICYLSAYICAYIVKISIEKNYSMQEMEKIQNSMRLQYEIINQKKENDYRIKIMVHDLRKQIAALKDEKAYEVLNERLKEYQTNIYSDNSVLNAILSEKERMAKDENIEFTVESYFGDFGFIDDLDLCSIFANALDNAIEACEKCEDNSRFITLRYNESEAFILVSIINSLPEAVTIVDNGIKTSKNDKENHGLGLKSMKMALDKYNGTLSINAESVFTLQFFIPKP
ncbi:MAG: ATP-binding protein [Erysipelotrichaceae bacterium]